MINLEKILEARILIVDDLEANVALLEQMLRGAGYKHVATTTDPHAVCQLSLQQQSDLVVLDLQMPGHDGFQVMKDLRALDERGSLPVLVVTAQPDHMLRALQAGANDFVSKPFVLGEVLMRVHNLLETHLLHRDETAANEVRLENSQQIANLGDWEHDFVHGRLFWSDEVYRILGISRNDFPPESDTFYRQVHPDDLAFVHQEKRKATEGARRIEFEHRIIRADGEVRYIHQIAGTVFDDQGRPTRESGTLQDVTERKATEAALSASERRYRIMFERNPSPMWAFDPQTMEFLAVNDSAIALYGYSREEFLRMNVKDVLSPKLVASLVESSANSVDRFHAVGRFEHQRKTGTAFPVDILAYGIDFAGRPAQLVLAIDMTESERSIASLRAGEARFRALSESAPIGIFESDAGGRVIYSNSALTALSGSPVGVSLGGKKLEEHVHPDDRQILNRNLTRAFAEGGTWDQTLRLLRPDGSVCWVHILAGVRKDAEGLIMGLVGTVENISERQQAEEILQRRTTELRVLYDLMPAMVWFKDTNNHILRVNQRGADSVGRPVGEIEGKSELEIHPREAARSLADDLEVIASGVPKLGIVEKVVDPKGRETWVETDKVPYCDKDGKVIGIVVMAQDITARRASELALVESEARFKFVARAVSDVVWDWNIPSDTLWRNDGFLAIFGYTNDDLKPGIESWTCRLHPDERDQILASLHAALDTGAESWSADYRFQRKDGNYAQVHDRGYILRDAAGLAVRMVRGMRDVTEQKKMEAQYLRAQRMESIGTLAGGIAHDLNNVLAPIMMSIELLKSDSGNDPRTARILDCVQVSCRRGADLVRQVLTFARGVDGERIPIRLRHLIGDLDSIVSETFPPNIRIVTDVPNDLWPVTGDSTQIHQVLLNLAVNARDAMPRGGTLTVSANNVTLDAQYAGTSPGARSGTYVMLQVTDTGQGMTPKVRERIFEPFFTTKEVGEGTGIGLATAHAIVKSHEGFINVESEVGRGTTFKVYLPAQPAPAIAATVHPFQTALPRGQDELVLVVDDELSIREITEQTLEAFGYRVIVASDGAEAVALYARQMDQVAVVLTDMMMPIMDGQATIEVLMRINPAVKIIAASGVGSNASLGKARDSGVRSFLQKPYTAESLLRLIREVLDGPVRFVPNEAPQNLPGAGKPDRNLHAPAPR